MRTIFAACVCCLLFPALASAQWPLAPATGKSIDLGLGYSYARQGQHTSSPVRLMGGDASISFGYSCVELEVDLGYARSAPLGGTGRHSAALSYLAGPAFHPTTHRDFHAYVQVLAGPG